MGKPDNDMYSEYETDYYSNVPTVTKPTPKVVKPGRVQPLARKIPLVIPEDVMKQIKYLTRQISAVEWSGVLFYTVEGDINNPDDFKVILQYIYLMDKGTGAATDYDYDEELIDFRMENPHSLEWKIGHIHSHNSMGAYFSGVDTGELEDNVVHHNYYLSVVVNNALDAVGRIAFLGSVQDDSVPYSCKDGDGKDYTLNVTTKEDVMFTYDCTVEKGGEEDIDENFAKRLKTVVSRPKPVVQHTAGYGRGNNSHMTVKKSEKESTKKEGEKGIGSKEERDWEDEFPTFWVSFGAMGSEDEFMTESLDGIKERMTRTNKQQFLTTLISNSADLYQKYFGIDNEIDIVEAFSTVYNEILDYVDMYEYAEDLLKALEPFLTKLAEIKEGGE